MPREKEKSPTEELDDGTMANDDEEDLAYDPDQNPEERRAVRKAYRALDEALAEQRKDVGTVTFSYLRKHIDESNKFLKLVKAPQEATLDSRIFLNTIQLAGDVAKHNASTNRAFDTADFVQKLLTFMGGRGRTRPAQTQNLDDDEEEEEQDEIDDDAGAGPPLQWENVARLALAKSRRVGVPDFMLGPLAMEVKERVVKKRVAHEKQAEPERRPQELTEQDIQKSENETTKNVLAIGKLLKRAKRVNLFRFIINPKDFAQSVENLFYLSFIIKEGQCGIEIKDNGEPEIFACAQPTDDDYARGVKKNQIVFTLTMDDWDKAITTFNITEPMIPNRAKSSAPKDGKWYG
ncbi:Nse4 C-terminal-domain-containing protein [Auriculariales sp. MPI-PUGE-AT-0066]|nr:Nse4 C-terminal-domain-containing protein [Auriculariales sp. MPI-PUGE-AT-0066]